MYVAGKYDLSLWLNLSLKILKKRRDVQERIQFSSKNLKSDSELKIAQIWDKREALYLFWKGNHCRKLLSKSFM